MQELREEIQHHDTLARWGLLEAQWASRFPDIDAILVKDGSDQDSIKLKILALQSFLLRHEFSNSVLAVGPKALIVLTGKDKLELLAHLPEAARKAGKTVTLIERTDKPSQDFEQFHAAARAAKFARFGGFGREKQEGSFIEAFEKDFADRKAVESDVSAAFQELMAVKVPADLTCIAKCAKANVELMRHFIKKVEDILNDGTKTTHEEITNSMESQITKSKKDLEKKHGIKTRFLDYPYNPVIQSGRNFDLRIDAQSNKEPLAQNYILLNLSTKYFEMNTNLFRTLLVDPTTAERNNYQALSKIHDYVIGSLAPGVRCSEVYTKTVDLVKSTYPDLVASLPNSFGFGIGYEFREACLLLNAKNEKGELRAGHVIVVVTSLKDLKGRNDQLYSMHLSDTVQITEAGHANLTADCSKKLDEIGYTLDDNESEEPAPKPKREMKASAASVPLDIDLNSTGPMGTRTRAARRMEEFNREQGKIKKMAQHQMDLLDIKMQELERRLIEGDFESKSSESTKIALEKLKAYTPETFPAKANPRNILVDMKRNSVLLPINGQLVPFHVSCLKNVTKHAESKTASLRFNFFTPGVTAGNITFPSSESYGAHLVYIKELTFRSSNVENYNQIAKDIKEIQKSIKQSMSGAANAGPERLTLANKLKFISDIKMRPAMNGRKTAGTLTAYENGFRFTNKSTNEQFDLSLANIKHAIFQPCDQDMVVIIHFALHNKVIINRKDYTHVQFYMEVGMLTEDLNDPRRRGRGHDHDEFEEEEMERQARDHFNKLFIDFCTYVEKHWKSDLKFDSPFPESGFHGSHAYNNVMILPTSHCFVSLVEQPFLVVAYADIEVISLERIDKKIKNFDMTVVFRDFSKPVLTITNIPKNKLEMLKVWIE